MSHRYNTRSKADRLNTLTSFKKSYKRPLYQLIHSTRRIKSFLRKYDLNTICSDSNECIALGVAIHRIKALFDHFNPSLSTEQRLLNDSYSNGTVSLLTFRKKGYVANAVLKKSKREAADNLFYEGVVGNFINKKRLQFPCFVETYGIYLGTDKVEIDEENLLESCNNPLEVSIVIENIKGAKSIDFLRTYASIGSFMTHEMLYVLYQVYAPLSILCNDFTHYDLHEGNIILYEPVRGKCITYHYHYDQHTVSFHSRYIVRIIDYGRCFFKDDTINSADIYDTLCAIGGPDCEDCGDTKGFAWLEKSTGKDLRDNFFISAQERNMSHDLILLDRLKRYTGIDPIVDRILDSVYYEDEFGTPENVTMSDDAIYNVNGAKEHLEKAIAANKHLNDTYDGIKLGDMHIYCDEVRPIEYIPYTR